MRKLQTRRYSGGTKTSSREGLQSASGPSFRWLSPLSTLLVSHIGLDIDMERPATNRYHGLSILNSNLLITVLGVRSPRWRICSGFGESSLPGLYMPPSYSFLTSFLKNVCKGERMPSIIILEQGPTLKTSLHLNFLLSHGFRQLKESEEVLDSPGKCSWWEDCFQTAGLLRYICCAVTLKRSAWTLQKI